MPSSGVRTPKHSKRSSPAISTYSSPNRTTPANTIRRMPTPDIRAIFESLHQHAPAPAHLKFQIVPVGPNGKGLSPPSYEFNDGLYVLLRPRKKKKDQGPPIRVPAHLTHLVIPIVPPESCPWSLSGPQFPEPTAFQQRYCYPKGPAGYSSKKGGALWTMFGTDGKEDLEFRILHVYLSAKRAINKGVTIPQEELDAAAAVHPVPNNRTPNRSPANKKRQAFHHLASPPHQRPRHQYINNPQSPAITTSSINSATMSSLCSSPLSFDMLLPPSPAACSSLMAASPFEPPTVSPPDPFRRNSLPGEFTLMTPSPFRRGPPQMLQSGSHNYHNYYSNTNQHSIRQSPVVTHGLDDNDNADDATYDASNNESSMEHLSYDMDSSLQEIDSYWNDPLLTTIMLKPSLDVPSITTTTAEAIAATPATNLQSLTTSLEGVQETIRESILAAEPRDQAALVSLVAAWARRVATDPLEIDYPARQRALRHSSSNITTTATNTANNNWKEQDHDHDDDTLQIRNGATAAV